MQNVIKNLGKNLDNMNVYSLFIFSMDLIYMIKRLQRYTKNPN